MEWYLGIDVHRDSCRLVVLSASGKQTDQRLLVLLRAGGARASTSSGCPTIAVVRPERAMPRADRTAAVTRVDASARLATTLRGPFTLSVKMRTIRGLRYQFTNIPRHGTKGKSGVRKYSSTTETTPTVMCCVVVLRVFPPKYAAAGHQRSMRKHAKSANKQHSPVSDFPTIDEKK